MGPETGKVRHAGGVIEYSVVRSARRRKTIQISLAGGGVKVSAPRSVPAAEIAAIVARRAAWILKRLPDSPGAAPPALAMDHGTELPYRGTEIVIDVVDGSAESMSAALVGKRLVVTAPTTLSAAGRVSAVRTIVARWYGEQALLIVRAAVDHWQPILGVRANAVLVRDQRSRWGSCSSNGALRFNWRVAMLNPELAEYIVVHELCHLRHGNHSTAFWDLVRSVLPAVDERRKQLRSIVLPG